jgi:hypothetical protein
MIATTLETAPLAILESLFSECAMQRMQARIDLQDVGIIEAEKRQDMIARAYMPRVCSVWSMHDTRAPRHAMRKHLFAGLVLSAPDRLASMSRGGLRDFIERYELEIELGHFVDGLP